MIAGSGGRAIRGDDKAACALARRLSRRVTERQGLAVRSVRVTGMAYRHGDVRMNAALKIGSIALLGTMVAAPAFAQLSDAIIAVERDTGGLWADNLGRHPESAFPCLRNKTAAQQVQKQHPRARAGLSAPGPDMARRG
jgi:hypothetical protein